MLMPLADCALTPAADCANCDDCADCADAVSHCTDAGGGGGGAVPQVCTKEELVRMHLMLMEYQSARPSVRSLYSRHFPPAME